MALGRRAGLRVSRPVRNQMAWETGCLDDLIAADHRVRQVWAWVESLDLSVFYDVIAAVEGRAGRPPIDPAILMTLWLYATLEGVGSARLLERLCQSDTAYRWICGGVGVNHHSLSDFRVAAGPMLDELLTRSMAALVAAKIVGVDCLAVDGVRVRASAGASSFRSKDRLVELEDAARRKVARLREELQSDPAAGTRRAQERAAREAEARLARLEAARKAAEAIEEERRREAEKQRRRTPKKAKVPRGSTTDAQARIMSMADGGYRPAYNLQFKTDPKAQARAAKDKAKEGPGVRAWRERMAQQENVDLYRKRFACERPHADVRNRGLQKLMVRGMERVRAVGLWYVTAYNFLQIQRLTPQAA